MDAIAMDQPLVTFVLITYNQEAFVRDALESAIAQTYSPLEIVVCDDCSKDRTYDIIKEVAATYRGPHRLILNRNDRNLGIAGNINRAMELASGEFFIMAAGDDVSVEQRAARLVEQMNREGTDLACSYFEEIDVGGKPTGWVKKEVLFLPDPTRGVHRWRCGATGACAAYRRKLYDKYGPLTPMVVSEDWIFSFRAWLETGCTLVEEPLVKHRSHDKSLSVLHRNVDREHDRIARRRLRKGNLGNELARARLWLDALQRSGKTLDAKVMQELEEWIRLVEIEWEASESGQVRALLLAVKALFIPSGPRRAVRMVYRYVLRVS